MNILSNSALLDLSNEELFLIGNYKQCPVHPKRKLTCISTDPTSKYYLKCLDCITLSTDKNFLPLLSVLDSDNKTIFKSWPVINDSEFYDELVDISQKKSFAEDTKEQIKSFFKQFRAQIDLVLEEKQIEMMKHTDSLWNINDKVLNQYNQLCAKEELRDIILNKKESFDKQNKILGETIQRILHNQEGNKKAITDSLIHLKNQMNIIDFEYPNQLKKNIIQSIKDIDLFLIKNLEDMRIDNTDRLIQLRDRLDQLQPAEMTTSQLIMKLMNNKVNNCSDQLLNQLNNVISTVEGFINKTPITGLNNEQILELDKLSQQQLSNMKVLGNKYLEEVTYLLFIYLINYHLFRSLSFFDQFFTNLFYQFLKNVGEARQAIQPSNNKQILMKLISNKFNFCSLTFLNQLSTFFENYQFILEELDLSNMLIEGKHIISADSLTKQQIEEISNLILGFEKLNLRNSIQIGENNNLELQSNNLKKFNSLFENKSNYCSSDFISNSKSASVKYPQIIHSIFLQNQNIFKDQYNSPISFDQLDDKQLKNIQILVDKISQLSQQFGNDYQNGQFPSENRQPNSYKINTCLSQNKNFLSQKEFSQLLNDYPICELSNLQFKYTILNLDFIKTYKDNSQELKIERMQEGKIRIIQQKSLQGQIVTQNKLDVNTNYIFRCKLNTKFNVKNYLDFGIMKSSNIHTHYLYSENCCYETNSNDYGLDSLVKGRYLCEIRSEIDCVEVRVNIGKRILMYADYPNYSNINSTNPNKIQQNGDYSFGIYFGNPSDNIVVEIESITIGNGSFSQFS